MSSHPTIQSFFKREIPLAKANEVASLPSGDGFTKEEVANALDPLNTKFNPSREYRAFDIGSLTPGPNPVMFQGRVVNFSTHFGKSKSQSAAKGWHHMIMKDNTGTICVSLN
jgi:hypothetical protein